jgi:sulfopyruvate decarboxylase TPP-binding subunit
MMDGPSVAAALAECGVTHVVWVPDSELGRWDEALRSAPALALIRATREGEAIGIAAGLLLGGARPVVMIQCTGLFEAGDALRNVVHDMKLPLFLVVGVRSLLAHRKGATTDNCPAFTEPIVQAWGLPYTILDERHGAAELAEAYRLGRAKQQAAVVLVAE